MFRKWLPRLVAAGLVAVVAGCSDDAEVRPEEIPPSELYRRAEGLIGSSPVAAAEAYEEIEQYHPYAPEAKMSILRAAEAHYQAGKFDEALAAADRFLSYYPGDAAASRAHFVRALSEYDQIADPTRTQSRSRAAERELVGLIQRYPDSEFATEAELRLDAVRAQLAAHELEIGRFYLRQGRHSAAINRFRVIVDTYPTTEQVAEALFRLVEANLSLGLRAEARRAAVILGYNFPGSEWYRDAYDLVGGRSLGG